MSTILHQTKRVIDDLKAAGFARSDFKVRCPFDRSKMGYGEVKISLMSNPVEDFKRAPAAVANGNIDVTTTIITKVDYPDGYICIPYYTDGAGRLIVHDYATKQRYSEKIATVEEWNELANRFEVQWNDKYCHGGSK